MEDDLQLLGPETKTRVSSTLDKSVGKKYLTDGSPETCWTSQQGTPQYIQFTFPARVIPRKLQITFQGGFVGTTCTLEVTNPTGDSADKQSWRTWTQVFPEDVNRSQTFDLPVEGLDHGIEALKLVFEKSSDFFGRITVYDIQLKGSVL